MRLWFVVLSVTVVSIGCGAGSGDSPAPSITGTPAPAADRVEAGAEKAIVVDDLVGVWLLEDLAGVEPVDTVQTTLELDAEGRVSGHAGCNRYTGSYTVTEGRLEFGTLAGTKKMCPEPVMSQEDGFHRALGSIERVVVEDAFLMLFVEGSETPLRFSRRPVDPVD